MLRALCTRVTPLAVRTMTTIPATFLHPRATTEFYRGNEYDTIGLYHITDTQGVSAIREIGTGISNMFGMKGFENQIYDNLRKETLGRMSKFLGDNPDCMITCIRMDFNHGESLLVHNLYGTLLKKKSAKG